MQQEFVLTLGQRMLEVVAMLTAPLLIPALLVGLLVGMFQAATQINEMTLSFIPKILAVATVMIVIMPWMMNTMIDFTTRLLNMIKDFPF